MKLPDLHVMHVPSPQFPERSQMIDDLREGWSEAEVVVWEDPDRKGILFNFHQALRGAIQTAQKDQNWVIVAADDAQILNGTLREIGPALRFAPAPFVSLCHFNTHGLNLVKRGIPYGLSDHSTWGQMIAYHRSVWDSFLALVEDVIEMDYEAYKKWDDGLPTVHNLLYGTKSCFTARAVVQHIEAPSVLGHNLGHWRHAHATIETHTGPWWGLKPRFGGAGTVRAEHRELAEKIVKYRSGK